MELEYNLFLRSAVYCWLHVEIKCTEVNVFPKLWANFQMFDCHIVDLANMWRGGEDGLGKEDWLREAKPEKNLLI